MYNIDESEKTYSEYLYANGYIREPKKCSCVGIVFSIQFNMIIHLKLFIVFLDVKIINAGTGIQ